MSKSDTTATPLQMITMVVALVGGLVVFILILTKSISAAKLHAWRELIWLSFIVWAAMIAAVKDLIPKKAIATAQVLFALWSNDHQIDQIARSGLSGDIYTRVTFIVAGLAVMVAGIGKLIEAEKDE